MSAIIDPPHPPYDPNRIRVYWAPGCTSCLRTKEFLTKQGIEFDSVNVQNNAEAKAEIKRLGARAMPIVSLGQKFATGQSFGDIAKFLNVDIKVLGDPLPPDELFEKLDMVLTAAARYTRQMPLDKLKVFFRNRERTIGDTCYHTFRVSSMSIDSLEGRMFTNAGFTELAPADWTFNRIADWGLGVRDHIRAWRSANRNADLKNLVETYYGTRTLHDIMDRTTYHSAQHMRQLMLMLEEFGVTVDGPVTMEDLKGVPVPEAAWG